MIVYLDIKIKKKCVKCSGTGEILKDREVITPSEHRLFTYMCGNCDGTGHTWKKRTITSKQFKGILDEEN